MTTTKKMGRDSGKSATQTTGKDSITLSGTAAEPRVDSRLLAQYLGNRHQHVRELLTDYAEDFRQLGILRFQTGEIRGRGQPERYALLNEDQAYLLLAYSRNTRHVRDLKVRLVLAFREARQRADLHGAEYLPTYHGLHDEIARLAHGSSNARFVHLNVNRAINQAVGIESGSRKYLSTARQSILAVAQSIAAQAMARAHDHHEGYQQAKAALRRLGTVLIGGS
jgi:phage regulator Rha-like protein